MSNLSTDAQFFFEHAGFSYDREKETQEHGRTRGAMNLAAAEAWARAAGVSFNWVRDEGDSPMWVLLAYDCAGKLAHSCGGVDFGDGAPPWGNSYRRVIEAEVAADLMTETMAGA